MPRDQQLCPKCGGSGHVLKWEIEPPSSRQKRLLVEHSFNRHEVFRLLDRVIASQVIVLEGSLAKEDGLRPSDIWEEAMLYCERAEKAFTEGKSDLVLNCIFRMACNMIYLLERAEFSGVDSEK